MTPLTALKLAASPTPGVPALLQVPCTVRLSAPGASPPTPWHPHLWRRWFPWWWFQ